MDIGSPTSARTWDLRINSPSGHLPEIRASQILTKTAGNIFWKFPAFSPRKD